MNEVDVLIRRLRALVRARELLRDGGASEPVLERRSAEIRRLQGQLADQVRRMIETG
jgi:hypothetical protein